MLLCCVVMCCVSIINQSINHRLRCIGPSQELKNRFGGYFTLHINYTVGEKRAVDELIEELAPNAHLEEDYLGSATYHIPKADLRVSTLFEMLSAREKEAGM